MELKIFNTTSYLRSPVMTLVWRVKLIWVVQCFGFKIQRLVHCVGVSFACNDLGLVFQACLDGSMLRIQDTKIGVLR